VSYRESLALWSAELLIGSTTFAASSLGDLDYRSTKLFVGSRPLLGSTPLSAAAHTKKFSQTATLLLVFAESCLETGE